MIGQCIFTVIFFQLDYLFENVCNKMLQKRNWRVFRDRIMLGVVGLKEFGPYPKMDRKPLKDFDRGEI